jgi:hypothetical protein
MLGEFRKFAGEQGSEPTDNCDEEGSDVDKGQNDQLWDHPDEAQGSGEPISLHRLVRAKIERTR